MSLTDKTARKQTESLHLEFDLRHSPEKVWRALTDPALLSEWLLPVIDLDLDPGSSFTFVAPPQPGWDGVVNCRILEIEPHRKLSYSWQVGDPASEFFLDTVVIFTLAQTDSGTLLNVVQSGFKPDQKKNFGGARYGWRMMGERLIALLERPD